MLLSGASPGAVAVSGIGGGGGGICLVHRLEKAHTGKLNVCCPERLVQCSLVQCGPVGFPHSSESVCGEECQVCTLETDYIRLEAPSLGPGGHFLWAMPIY